MNLLKKLGVSILTAAMLTVSAFGISSSNSYAATSCKKVIKPNITYKYDIDGDKDKDTIKVYESKGKLLLKVNSCTTTLISDYNADYYSYNVKIYDFNNKDKSVEIVLEWAGDSECATRILKFKNNTCKVNKFYYDASVSSYNPSTGMLSLSESELGRFSKFTHAIGCFSCFDKVKVNGYTLSNQLTANTHSVVRKNKYIAAKNLTAYTSTKGTKKAFTIKKDSYTHIYALYQNGNKRYIKVKNSAGKYGYVKIGSSLLFKESSCLWWR